jgi:lysophospholipase L1-like esterase
MTTSRAFASYIAIGDSFTEGLGDEYPDGRERGWADLVALGLALASPEPFRYANLAIRGRLLAPIISDQLDAAIAQHPDLISLNGGGNDIMRPRVSIDDVAGALIDAADRAIAAGSHVLLASGGNPTGHLPMGRRIFERGELLAEAVRAHLPREGVTFVDNWADAELASVDYWARDGLHLSSRGHRRVASNMLADLGIAIPDFGPEPDPVPRPRTAEHWREYVLPWLGRRLTGRSSGDGRSAKIPELQEFRG